MIDPTTQILRQLIRNHGVEAADDARRLEALLKDYARGHYKREIHLWVLAAREGIARALLNNKHLPLPKVTARASKQLHEDYGIDMQAAEWAVESWVVALELTAAMLAAIANDKDEAQAARWYRVAAEQGDAAAQNNLGLMYEYGRGVEQDYEKAVFWYQKSADQGNVFAQKAIARLLSEGKVL